MMKITDLADALAERQQLSKSEANFFIPLFVDVLTSGLRKDKIVKIRGLGTFKVTSVNARESVDVNTGERITIEGRDKITFVPEPSLRDKVNSPFEQFATVTVSDDADFSEIDRRYQEQEDVEQEEESQLTPQDNPMDEKAPDDGDCEVKEPAVPVETSLLSTKEDIREEEVETSPTIVSPEPADSNSLQQVEMEMQAERSELTELNEDNRQLREKLERTRRNQKMLIAAVCVLLLAVCLGGYYIGRQFAVRDNRIEQLTAEWLAAKQASPTDEKTVAIPVPPTADSTAAAGSAQAPSASAATNMQAAKQPDDAAQTTKRNQQVSTRQPSDVPVHRVAQPTNNKYDADPRIRTGAYTITGIAQTVTVRPGQTLASISRAYLGPGMECYVEAVNQQKEVKAGDQVKIPALKLKKKTK